MQTKPALKVLALYLPGILLGRFFQLPAPLILGMSIFTSFLAFIIWYTDKGNIYLKNFCLALTLILIGSVRYDLSTGYFPGNHISHFTSQKRPIAISGIIVKYPEPRLNKINLTIDVHELFLNQKIWLVQGKILVSIPKKLKSYQYGDEILVRGKLNRPRDRRNPGEFDYRAYLLAQDIYGIISIQKSRQIQKISTGYGSWILSNLVFPVKAYLENYIENQLPIKEAKLLQGLLIGQRGEIPFELREAFSQLGVIHILAVSGLHVGFIILIFMGILGFVRVPHRYLVLLTLIALVFYALLTNLKPPVVRASIMAGFILSGTILERKTDTFNTLALAALVILIFNPLELFQAGFQLSFAAVISIVYLYPKIKNLFMNIRSINNVQSIPFIRYILELLFVSIAAFLGTLPFTMIYFNRLPNFAPLANLLIIPMVFCGLSSGICASTFNIFIPFLAKIYLTASWFFLHILIKLVEWASQLPMAFWENYKFLSLQACAYAIGLLLLINLRQKRVRRWLLIYGLVLANLFVWQAIAEEKNVMEVIFFDVGQGDAALVTLPSGRHVLIDGGPRAKRYDAGKWVIAPYLKREKIHTIDALIISHADADHIGGVPYLLRHFQVHEVWDNGWIEEDKLHQEYLALIDSLKISRRILAAGQTITDFNPVRFFILNPFENDGKQNNLSSNDGSLCVRLSYGEVDFLFVGDIEKKGEQQISRYGHLLESEVLKVSHHGANTSSSRSFLQMVQPEMAVISVGELNKFGHPHIETLRCLYNTGAKIFRTDLNGSIILKTNGLEIKQINWK